MTCDFDKILVKGGRERLRLLQYCVLSVQCDGLFVYLAQCFKSQPSSPRAICLFDVFFHPNSIMKLSVADAIPPRNLQIGASIDKLRQSVDDFAKTQAEDPENAIPPLLPSRYLFDRAVEQVSAGAQVAQIQEQFDPQLDAVECLPGGKMTPGQRSFVSQTWVPQVRPLLVRSGFHDLASIGAD